MEQNQVKMNETTNETTINTSKILSLKDYERFYSNWKSHYYELIKQKNKILNKNFKSNIELKEMFLEDCKKGTNIDHWNLKYPNLDIASFKKLIKEIYKSKRKTNEFALKCGKEQIPNEKKDRFKNLNKINNVGIIMFEKNNKLKYQQNNEIDMFMNSLMNDIPLFNPNQMLNYQIPFDQLNDEKLLDFNVNDIFNELFLLDSEFSFDPKINMNFEQMELNFANSLTEKKIQYPKQPKLIENEKKIDNFEKAMSKAFKPKKVNTNTTISKKLTIAT